MLIFLMVCAHVLTTQRRTVLVGAVQVACVFLTAVKFCAYLPLTGMAYPVQLSLQPISSKLTELRGSSQEAPTQPGLESTHPDSPLV